LADAYLTRESSHGSLYEEVRLDTEESELSDSSSELVDPSEALDGPVDETAPPNSEEELKPVAKSSKKASRKKYKGKKTEDVSSPGMP
jgi:hypothetical protein